MPLPTDFRWVRAFSTAYDETVLVCGQTWVVVLYQEHRGEPFQAALGRHLPREQQVIRQCSSLAKGKAGAEIWATRHEDRIRREILALQQQRRLDAVKPPDFS